MLAAGGGRRYGGPKALVRHDDGRLLVERAVAALRDGGCAPILVVVGAEADRVRAEAALGETAPGEVVLVDNPSWKAGMGSSLRAGLDAVGATGAEAVAVLLVDTPGIGPEAVRRVADAFGGPSTLVAASYRGRRGHPVLLGRDHWAGVSVLATADVGARAYLLAHAAQVQTVPCEDVADDTDIDVPPASP